MANEMMVMKKTDKTGPAKRRTFVAAAALTVMLAAGGTASAQSAEGATDGQNLSEWLKICNVDPKTNKNHCLVTRDMRTESGQFLGTIMVREIVNEKRKRLGFSIPLGLLVQPGVNIQIDKNKPKRGKIGVCLRNGCYGEVAIDSGFIGTMKKGNNLIVTALNQQNKQISFRLSLAGFTATYDSKGLNPQEFQQEQKKLEDKLNERVSEMRQKLIDAQKKEKDKAQ